MPTTPYKKIDIVAIRDLNLSISNHIYSRNIEYFKVGGKIVN